MGQSAHPRPGQFVQRIAPELKDLACEGARAVRKVSAITDHCGGAGHSKCKARATRAGNACVGGTAAVPSCWLRSRCALLICCPSLSFSRMTYGQSRVNPGNLGQSRASPLDRDVSRKRLSLP